MKGKIFHIYANEINIGDLCSALVIKNWLREHLPSANYIPLLCDAPHIERTKEVLNTRYTPEDIVVIGGGGLLINYFSPLWQWILNKPNLEYYLWGVGICRNHALPEQGDLPGTMISDIVAGSALGCVRDNLTLSKSLSKCKVIPCPAHLFPSIQALQKTTQERLLYIDHPALTGAIDKAGLISTLRLYSEERGLTFHSIDNILSSPYEDVTEYLKSNYANAKIIVSSRLHGAILGLSLGIPVIALGLDEKFHSYFSGMGLQQNITDKPEELVGLIDNSLPPSALRMEPIKLENELFAQELAHSVSSSHDE